MQNTQASSYGALSTIIPTCNILMGQKKKKKKKLVFLKEQTAVPVFQNLKL